MVKHSKKELEQLLADALADKERQANTIQELNKSVQGLMTVAQDLRQELDVALASNYRGVEGARRWLAEHIGYDLRQVAKCPTCLGTKTTPTNPEEIGAEFRCCSCGQVFYIVKVLDTHPATIRQAVKGANCTIEVGAQVVHQDDPYRNIGRVWKQLPSGRK